MNNLKNLLRTLATNPTTQSVRRNEIWQKIILPLSKEFEGDNPNRTGIYLQATFFKDGATPCNTICVQFGDIHPKNVFFAAEKTCRLWQTSDYFASLSADPLRESYSGLEWADLNKIKFGGAIKIFQVGSSDTAILSVSGLHPVLDEATAYAFAHMFEESDSLSFKAPPGNSAVADAVKVFQENTALFRL